MCVSSTCRFAQKSDARPQKFAYVSCWFTAHTHTHTISFCIYTWIGWANVISSYTLSSAQELDKPRVPNPKIESNGRPNHIYSQESFSLFMATIRDYTASVLFAFICHSALNCGTCKKDYMCFFVCFLSFSVGDELFGLGFYASPVMGVEFCGFMQFLFSARLTMFGSMSKWRGAVLANDRLRMGFG